MSELIEHPRSNFVRLLNEFGDSPLIDTFIEACSIAIKYNFETKELNDLWDSTQEKTISGSTKSDYFDLLSNVIFHPVEHTTYQAEIDKKSGKEKTNQKEQNAEVEIDTDSPLFVNQAVESSVIKTVAQAVEASPEILVNQAFESSAKLVSIANRYWNEKIHDKENNYGWFSPAWEIEHILPVYYNDENNPGVIINNYLKELYQNESVSSESKYVPKKEMAILLKKISKYLFRKKTFNAFEIAIITYLHTLEWTEGDIFFYIIITLVDQRLFELALSTCLSEEVSQPEVNEDYLHLLFNTVSFDENPYKYVKKSELKKIAEENPETIPGSLFTPEVIDIIVKTNRTFPKLSPRFFLSIIQKLDKIEQKVNEESLVHPTKAYFVS